MVTRCYRVLLCAAVLAVVLAIFGVGVSSAGSARTREVGFVGRDLRGSASAIGALAELTDSRGDADDTFGDSVAMSGRTIVVGEKGVALVFVRPKAGWSGEPREVARLTASDGSAGDAFGSSVAISGDTIVVGAPLHPGGGQPVHGEAYVFQKPAAGWSGSVTESVRLLDPPGPPTSPPIGPVNSVIGGDEFGYSVAVSGSAVVVGARLRPVGGRNGQGEAFVFTRPRSGWSGAPAPTATLSAARGGAGDEFGFSVAMSADTIVVGAVFAAVGRNQSRGDAYVFARHGSGWSGALTPSATLAASSGNTGDYFGNSVAVSGGTVVVGAPFRTLGRNTYQGEAYVFGRPRNGWFGALTETASLTAAHGTLGDMFGTSVAVSGPTIVAGEYQTAGPHTGRGQVFVFTKPRSGWSGALTPATILPSSGRTADGWFGFTLAISGKTIVVGAPRQTVRAHRDQGAAYVF